MRLASLALVSVFSFATLQAQKLNLTTPQVSLQMDLATGQYTFLHSGSIVVAADKNTGIVLNGEPVHFTKPKGCIPQHCLLHGTSTSGQRLALEIVLQDGIAKLTAEPTQPSEVRFQTAGASPAYGLADHAVYKATYETHRQEFFSTDVTGFSDDAFLSGQGIARLVSNFVIYPRQGFAALLIDPYTKIVHTSAEQIMQGVKESHGKVRMFYFFGDPHQIYAAYLKARNDAGYRVWMPKYQAFGVGWEAFGALGWDTNTRTVQDNVDHYLQLGFPLKWMVIGSGFWPSTPDTMHETTSFGLWDKKKYPDPKDLVQHFLNEKLAVMLGLRITFIVDGPFSKEGAEHGYFLKDENGQPAIHVGSWPKLPYYLLDAHNDAALDWYMGLVKKWQDYGINGWKEDFYGYEKYPLRDDKVDPTNDRLMQQKQLVIERNGYLSSNGDLHRINDFNYNQNQDRGPVNALALAYSGFPFVYPDIVGGTFGEDHFSTQRTHKMEVYIARNAQWAALHASMAMGEPPWKFRPEVASVMLQAAKLHERIAPYLYSNARKSYRDGYPWSMTPLPVAYPDDPAVHSHENSSDRRYEWMIGEALLATPLYGDDYETANTRDIYLPRGTWMDFDSGKLYEGNQTLKGYALPTGKTPLFIGGSGITLQHVGDKDQVVVYPVTARSSTTLTLPESDVAFTVRIEGKKANAWRTIVVKDGNGKIVASHPEGHGFSFIPVAGASYLVSTQE